MVHKDISQLEKQIKREIKAMKQRILKNVTKETSVIFNKKLFKIRNMVHKDISHLGKQIKKVNQTLWENEVMNREMLKNLTTETSMTLNNIEKELKKLPKFGTYTNPGKSCLDILQKKNVTYLSNGEYWILIDNIGPIKVFCDMKTDGGGWLLVSNIVLQNSNPSSWGLATSYRGISDYNSDKLGLSTYALEALRKIMPFTQLRFYCHKKIPGRTFHIVTKKNFLGENVVKFFTARTNSFPKACGSFYRLTDDNSIMARECSNWGRESGKYLVGKWSHDSIPANSRLFNHAAFVEAKVHWLLGRWECDDYESKSGFARSANDFWKIFVR